MELKEALLQTLTDITDAMTPAFQAYTIAEIALQEDQAALPSQNDVDTLADYYRTTFPKQCCGFSNLNLTEQRAYQITFEIYVVLTKLFLLLKSHAGIDMNAKISELLRSIFIKLDALKTLADPTSALMDFIAEKMHLDALLKLKNSMDDFSSIADELTNSLNDMAASASSRKGRIKQLEQLKYKCDSIPENQLLYYTVNNGSVIRSPFPSINQ